jgi:hypothetical protein
MNDSACLENSVFVLVHGAGLLLRMMVGCHLVLAVTVCDDKVGWYPTMGVLPCLLLGYWFFYDRKVH